MIIKKWKTILTVCILMAASWGAFTWYADFKNKKDIETAEKFLTEKKFDQFIETEKKEKGVICVKENKKMDKENISRDMLWTLEIADRGQIKAEEVRCENGPGIKIK